MVTWRLYLHLLIGPQSKLSKNWLGLPSRSNWYSQMVRTSKISLIGMGLWQRPPPKIYRLRIYPRWNNSRSSVSLPSVKSPQCSESAKMNSSPHLWKVLPRSLQNFTKSLAVLNLRGQLIFRVISHLLPQFSSSGQISKPYWRIWIDVSAMRVRSDDSN